MILVLGLGNPGAEFRGTRHNLGVEVLDELARRTGTKLKRSRQRALVAEATLASERVVLAFPQTYVNLSGEAAALLVHRFKPDTIVVVHDELDLPAGVVRVKAGGGLAGHNGLRSLKQHLHTDQFLRVRLGIGKPTSKEQGAEHVLQRLPKSVREELDTSVQRAADAVETIVAEGVDVAMNRFNGI